MFGRRWRAVREQVDSVHAELLQLREELSRRATELDGVRRGLGALEDRLSGIDGRITHMSTAVTNQLHELDAEIERLAATTDTASAEAVGQLRANQVRIANEQARYAIAMRQDLAELAEMLRRSRG